MTWPAACIEGAAPLQGAFLEVTSMALAISPAPSTGVRSGCPLGRLAPQNHHLFTASTNASCATMASTNTPLVSGAVCRNPRCAVQFRPRAYSAARSL